MIDFILKYWLEIIFTLICTVFSVIFKKFIAKQKEQEKKQKAVEDGVQALLRNELIRRYREYELKGELSILDRENIESMFKQYQNLGGNGRVKQLMDELLELPTKVIK